MPDWTDHYEHFESKPKEMSSSEYQRFYDCGLMPSRFWPEEFEKLKEEFAQGKISLKELEDSLDDMMGITWLQTSNYPLPKEHD